MSTVSLDGDLDKYMEKAKKKAHAAEAEAAKKKGELPDFDGARTPVLQPIQEGAKSAADGVSLPTGYLDDEQNIHREVQLKELSGEEEDILTSQNMHIHTRMNRVLENCVVAVGDYKHNSPRWKNIIRDLTATDRLFLILRLRILSLGAVYSAKSKCPECEHPSLQHVDLNDFEITGIKDPLKRTWKGKLPKSGMEYIAKVQTGWEEAKLAKHAQSKDLMSLAMLGRLVELNKKSPVTMHMVKQLSWPDRQHLRKEFTDMEGSIDKTMEYECESCGSEVKQEVDIASPNFFFPSETSTS